MSYNSLIHHRRSIRLKGYDYAQAGLYFITICVEDRLHLFGKIQDGTLQLNDAGKMVVHWYDELENKFSKIRCHEMIVMPNHFHCIIEIVGGIVGADLCVCPRSTDHHGMNTMDKNVADENAIIENAAEENAVEENVADENAIIENAADENIASGGRHTGLPLRDNHDVNAADENATNENMADKNATNEIAADTNVASGGRHIGLPLRLHREITIGDVVQWFKTMTTNDYIRGVKNDKWLRFNGRLWQRNYWEHIIRNQSAYENISSYILHNPSKWGEDIFYEFVP